MNRSSSRIRWLALTAAALVAFSVVVVLTASAGGRFRDAAQPSSTTVELDPGIAAAIGAHMAARLRTDGLKQAARCQLQGVDTAISTAIRARLNCPPGM